MFLGKEETLRLCADWPRLDSILMTDSDGVGDMRRTFSVLRRKEYFTRMDLATGFHQVLSAEKDKCKWPSLSPTAACGSSIGQG